MLTVESTDPTTDPRWDQWLAEFPESTLFHSASWTQVLVDTYRHRPFHIMLREGMTPLGLMPLLEVASGLSGRRGVCLPFTDLCGPLFSTRGHSDVCSAAGQAIPATSGGPEEVMWSEALRIAREREWRSLEIRASLESVVGSPPTAFVGHRLELTPALDELFQGFHSTCRRNIRKAVQSGVRVDISSEPTAVQTFYGLHCRTRRRHGAPPQPARFFDAIQHRVLEPGGGFVATARFQEKAVASAVFLHRGTYAVYKFGASDDSYQEARPNNLVFWEGIKALRQRGCERLHFGRTSLGNEGLRRFKLGWGAVEEPIGYLRYDLRRQDFCPTRDRSSGWQTHVFRRLPLPLLRLAGTLLYPHLD